MGQTVVLFWLPLASATAGAEVSRVSDTVTVTIAQKADASAWAAAQKIVLEAERPNTVAPALSGRSYDPALVDRIEAWLDQARSAAVALEESTALELLSQVETSLRDHPELPQAGWLMAEHHQILADVRAQAPEGMPEAAELRAQAELLEGPRSPAFSEQAGGPGAPAKLADFSITLTGFEARDRVEWDGRVVSGAISTGAGEHQVRVLRRGRLVHAAWTTVAEGTTTVKLDVVPVAACSRDDLAGVRAQGNLATPTPGTRCQSWAVARPSAQGGIDVARCTGDHCSALVHFERPKPADRKTQPVTREGKWSSLATYTLIGVGVLATTGVVLWQAGVFENEQERRTTWEFQGLQNTAFRF